MNDPVKMGAGGSGRSARDTATLAGDEPDTEPGPGDAGGQVMSGDEPAHEVFRKQIASLLDGADLSEDEKQRVLIAFTCPCCGAGGLSMSIDIRPRTKPGS